ncbi:retention module-containing protein [Chitinibacter sp. FCG-7]|uniref:Retention module-containing protein n=1 Tax=Chitinibacter mangrovi TaxID=3153927 RepID=A0AAU7F6L4_9NEIS
MATANQISSKTSSDASKSIANKGTVAQVIGEVKVLTASGEIRILQVGDKVQAGDTIQTGANGAISITFDNGAQMSLGRSDSLSITEQVLAELLQPANNAADDAARIQELIAQGADPTQIAAATAAGAGGGEDGGHSFVVLETPLSRVDIPTGVPTAGISIDPNLTLEDLPNNLPPDATDDNSSDADNDALTTPEDQPLIIAPSILLSNDVDPNGDTLTIISVQDATNGIVSLINGQIEFVPNENYNGSASFTYTVSDGRGETDTATVNINVTPVNDLPDAQDDNSANAANDALTTEEDTVLNIDPAILLANDTDIDGDLLTISSVQNAINGTVAIVDGQIIFTPDKDYNGPASFNYTVSDGNGGFDTATVNITVTPVNDQPVSLDDSNWTKDVASDSGSTTSGNVLLTIDHTADAPSGSFSDTADTDVDGNTLSLSSPGTFVGTYGTLVITSDGSYTYTLNANNTAVNALDDGDTLTDTFSYTVSDGDLTDSANLVITVFGTNDAPVANGTTESVNDTNWVKDVTSGSDPTTTGNVLLNIDHTAGAPSGTFSDKADTDVDNDTLIVSSAGTFVGTYGTLVIASDGSYSYTLNANNAAVNALDDGETLTDTFNYTVSDGDLADTANLVITVFGTNDAPIANGTTASIDDTNWVQDVTSDSNPTTTGNVLLNIDHTAGAPSGTYSDKADTDVDGDALSVSSAGTFVGAYGTLVIASDGSYSYTLDANNTAVNALDDGQTLADTFSYTVSDGNLTDTANLVITIFGTTEPPVIVNAQPQGIDDTNWVKDVVEFNQEESAPSASGNVLQNINHTAGAPSGNFSDQADTDVDGNTLSVSNAGIFVGAYGTLVLASNGSYTYTLDANNSVVNALAEGQSTSETFTYTVSDGSLTDTANLVITIFGTNDAPVANAQPVGSDDTNWVKDMTEGSNPTTSGNVLLNTDHPDDPSSSLSFSDKADTDVDGDTLTVSNPDTYSGLYGTLVLASNGSYTYTLNANNAAVNALGDGDTLTDTFSYTVSDGDLTDTANLVITIFGTNDAPVANAQPVGSDDTNWVKDVTEGSNPTTSGNVLLNTDHPDDPSSSLSFSDKADTDVDGDTLTVSNPDTYSGLYGTLVLASNGSYTYTLNANNAAVNALGDGDTLTDTFSYTVSDGDLTDTANLVITIFGTNDAPVANAQPVGSDDTNWVKDVTEGSNPTTSGNVLLNTDHPDDPSSSLSFSDKADTDVDGDTLTVSNPDTYSGLYGTLVLASNGSYTYTLNANNAAVNALGDGDTLTDTFSYTVSDGDLTDTANLVITIFGTNDAPVANAQPVGSDDTNWVKDVTEGSNPTASGNVLLNTDHPDDPSSSLSFSDKADTDVDGDTLTVSNPDTYSGLYGTLVLASNGSYTYTLNANNAAVNALGDGDTLTDTFSYTVSDGDLTDTANLVITIFGTNDAPVANAQPVGSDDTNWVKDVTEGSNPTTSGNVLLNTDHPDDPSSSLSFSDKADTDVDGDTLTVSNPDTYSGLYGTLVLASNGSYTYTLNANNAAVNALGDGDTLTDTFSYTVSDGDLTDTANLVITIFGTNDAPVANTQPVGSDDTNWVKDVTEGSNPTTSGNVLLSTDHPDDPSSSLSFSDKADTDVDGDTLTVSNPDTYSGLYGTLVLASNGSYTYTLNANNAAVNALGDGDTITDTFSYTVSDGDLTDTANLVITIFGTNDGVTITGLDGQGNEEIVYERNLNEGSAPDNTALTQTGTFTLSTPDGFGGLKVGTVQLINADGSLTGNSVSSTTGTLSILSFDGTTVNYSYTLDDNTTSHSVVDAADHVTDSFMVSVFDRDGDHEEASLDVTIVDDLPALSVNSIEVNRQVGTTTGNYDWDSGADTLTFSQAFANGALQWNHPADDGYTFALKTGTTYAATYVDGLVTKTFFEVTVNSDGTYSFNLVNPAPTQIITTPNLFSVLTPTDLDGNGSTEAAVVADSNFGGAFKLVLTGSANDGASYGGSTLLNKSATDIGVNGNSIQESQNERLKLDVVRNSGFENVTLDALTINVSSTGSLSSGDKVDLKVTYADASSSTLQVTYDNSGKLVFDIDSSKIVDYVELIPVTNNVTLKVIGITVGYTETIDPDDNLLNFSLTGIDADNDSAVANFTVNLMSGTSGNDTLTFGSGNDQISAGAGNDSIFANAGNDILNGGAGNDILNGGTGSDTFVFASTPTANGIDTIQNFTVNTIAAGGDVLDITDLLSGAGISAASFNATEGAFLQFVSDGLGNTKVMFDANGDTGGHGDAVQVATLSGIADPSSLLNTLLDNGEIKTSH